MLVKPPLGVQLIPGHPMNRGLVGWWLMNEGAGRKIYDLSGNGNRGTLVGNTHWVSGQYGSCLSFDGDGDYVSLGTPISGYPFTLMAWARFGADIDRSAVLVSLANSSYWGTYYSIGAATWGSYFRGDVWARIDGGTTYVINASPYAYPWDGWHHVTGVFASATDRKLFVDSVLVGTDDDSVAFSASVDRIFFGALADSSPTDYWNGKIDSVRIYNRALRAEQIKSLYDDPFQGLYQTSVDLWTAATSVGAPPPAAGYMTLNTGYWG